MKKILVSVLTFVALAGCGGPRFSSPELKAAATPPMDRSDSFILDTRRDGLVARAKAGTGEIEVVRVTRTDAQVIATVTKLRGTTFLRMASVDADNVMLFGVDSSSALMLQQVGTKPLDLGARLLAAVIKVNALSSTWPMGLDVATDGTVYLTMSVGGQGGGAPQHQLCMLSSTGDKCESIEFVQSGGTESPVVVTSTLEYLLGSDEVLYSRARGMGAAFTVKADKRVWQISALENDEVAFAMAPDSDIKGLHILDASGVEKKVVNGVSGFFGHRTEALFSVLNDRQTDGSCRGNWGFGRCSEAVIWRAFEVHALVPFKALGHREYSSGPGLDLGAISIPLGDGSVRVETNEVFIVEAK